MTAAGKAPARLAKALGISRMRVRRALEAGWLTRTATAAPSRSGFTGACRRRRRRLGSGFLTASPFGASRPFGSFGHLQPVASHFLEGCLGSAAVGQPRLECAPDRFGSVLVSLRHHATTPVTALCTMKSGAGQLVPVKRRTTPPPSPAD